MVKNGTIVAVSRASGHDFAKQPQLSITLVADEGVEGDAHRGRTVQHFYHVRRDPTQPNLCQVHLFANEMLTELATAGYQLSPGEIGENILVEELDLLALPQNTRLHLGLTAVVQVTGLRTPCVRMDRYRPGMQKHLWGEKGKSGQRQRRAGIMAVVLTGGQVQSGDRIVVDLPPLPHRPLGPV